MKVFFVGVHNKPGLTPLHSSTLTGKTIDEIIKRTREGVVCIKTNLFDTDSMPPAHERRDCLSVWSKRVGFNSEKDKVVLLGAAVINEFTHSYFLGSAGLFDHPAKVMSKKQRQLYIDSIVEYINDEFLP